MRKTRRGKARTWKAWALAGSCVATHKARRSGPLAIYRERPLALAFQLNLPATNVVRVEIREIPESRARARRRK